MADGRPQAQRRSWATLACAGLLGAAGAAALATHVADCWLRHDWLFLGIGVALWPLGVLHGVALWFGWA